MYPLSSSVQFSRPVVSDSLRPQGLQHASLPCPSPTPGACSNPSSCWWPSNHLILCHPLLLPPSVFLSIRIFSNESLIHIRWPKYWSFSLSNSPSNEYSGQIFFRIDWLDILAVQGTLRKSLLQHHSSTDQFSRAQFSLWSNFHIHTWLLEKSALTIETFVSKVMSLLFYTLSRFVIAFLPRSKRLLIS